ncbi:MAG: NUDIX hydrolase [Candidatus Pacebacteria bacterium]|nr:NUDIX hydrolase [Candidatus Paceibacterota bacterium]
MEIENCFYRISIKALILSETRDKFLIAKKENSVWVFPGGKLNWGETPHECLRREIQEEMGLEVLWIADNPANFLTGQTLHHGTWIANVLYETRLEHLNFTPSDECTEIRFVNAADIAELTVFPTVAKLAEQFNR